MAQYFAKIGADDIVVDVQVVADDSINTDEKGSAFLNGLYGTDDEWLHSRKDVVGVGSGNPRVWPAYIDGKYLREDNVFIDVCWFPSWTLDKTTYEWTPPKPKPADRPDRETYWNEDAQLWMFRKTEPDFGDDPVE